jgi:hypothetical protein
MTSRILDRSWLVILLFALSGWLWGQAPTIAAPVQSSPQTCRVGVYVVGLRDLDMVKSTFTSDFWIWAVCPSKDLKPLESMEFVNAKDVKTSYESLVERKDKFGQFNEQDKVYWHQKKVSGQFSHHWNVGNFPFDRHTLEIPIEEALNDTTTFTYTPDAKNSSYREDLQIEGWKLGQFALQPSKASYNTTFGDPNLSQAQSTFSRLVVSIDVQRSTIVSFFKLNAVVYIGFVLSLVTYFLDPIQISLISARISASVGSLFAVVVNQRAAESFLGRTETLTLTDQIHVSAMAYILFSIVISIYARVLIECKREKSALRMNKIGAYFAGISFVVLNIVLIAHAAIAG